MPEPEVSSLMTQVLWCLAGAMALWACLPQILALMGLSRYSYSTDENPAQLEPAEDDASYAGTFQQLRALGFEPLGTYQQRVRFYGIHWLWSCRTRVFGSTDIPCFACVYRLIAGEPVRVAFATCLEDGSMIWTGNHMEHFRKVQEGYVRWGYQTSDLAELLAKHREVVEHVVPGRSIPPQNSITFLMSASGQHSQRQLQQIIPGLAIRCLTPGLLWLSVFPVILHWRLGWELSHWTMPLAVASGAVVKVALEKTKRQKIAQERRQEVAADSARATCAFAKQRHEEAAR